MDDTHTSQLVAERDEHTGEFRVADLAADGPPTTRSEPVAGEGRPR